MSKIVLEKEEIEEKYRVVREQLNSKKLDLQRLLGDGHDDPHTRGKKLKSDDYYQKRIDELEKDLELRDEKQKRL